MVFQRKFFIALAVVFVAVVFFMVLGKNSAVLAVESKFFSFMNTVGSPVFSFARKVGDVRQGVLHYREIMEENHNLQDQYLDAVGRLGSFEEMEKENKSLREAFGIRAELGRDIVPAHSAGFFRDIHEEVLIVDKGIRDGVAAGNAVVWKDRVLVGRVIEAYDQSAKVLLITSASEKFDVVFAGKPLRVVAEGANAGELTLGFVPADATVDLGDIVLVSRANQVYPPGFIVGTVSRVRDSESRIFREVRVRSPFDPFQEETVYIVK